MIVIGDGPQAANGNRSASASRPVPAHDRDPDVRAVVKDGVEQFPDRGQMPRLISLDLPAAATLPVSSSTDATGRIEVQLGVP